MSSQKSNAIKSSEVARTPKRERGRLRVAAILDAGAQVFAEKGYADATMTEIAARADTAIGSLYRFFPSKESLADALLDRYAQQVVAALERLRDRAAGMSSLHLARALIDFMQTLQDQRQCVLVLIDARDGGPRLVFRAAMREGLAAVLQAATLGLDARKAQAMAPVLISVLKNVTALARAEENARDAYMEELQAMLACYLEQVRQ
ncbi:helix-turn-helix domain-containing protein [Dyella sp.]|uniref:TetR/AcrR family transcriptional regulator n=1 Tax=Dyella sp. TaxID=1869338 RepID=UPI002ED2A0B9